MDFPVNFRKHSGRPQQVPKGKKLRKILLPFPPDKYHTAVLESSAYLDTTWNWEKKRCGLSMTPIVIWQTATAKAWLHCLSQGGWEMILSQGGAVWNWGPPERNHCKKKKTVGQFQLNAGTADSKQVYQSINRPISESIHQSTDKSISQSINRSEDRSTTRKYRAFSYLNRDTNP